MKEFLKDFFKGLILIPLFILALPFAMIAQIGADLKFPWEEK